MITEEIAFHAPTTLTEALDLLAEQGEDVTVLAGGMSLVPMMNLGIARPEVVMSLNHLPDLDRIEDAGDRLVIGAGVRHARIVSDPLIRQHCPLLAEAAAVIGDVQVRNRGTVGGSVAHADPAADYLPVLAALGGEVTLRSKESERTLGWDEFLVGALFTVREPTELLTTVSVPKVPVDWGTGFQRLTRVEGSFAIVNAAAAVAGDRSRVTIGLGGVGPRPVVVDVTAHVADGLDEAALVAVGDAAHEASAEAFSDTASDSDYRREMARLFAGRALRAAADASGRE